MSLGDQSAGMVRCLEPWINHYFADAGIDGWVTTSPTQWAACVTADNGGSVDPPGIGQTYALLDRRGNAAIWRLTSAYVANFVPYAASPADNLIPTAASQCYEIWEPGETRPTVVETADGSDHATWVLPDYDRIYFMTVMLPWQRDHVRGETPEIVVAMWWWYNDQDNPTIWEVLTEQFMPEQTSWVVDNVYDGLADSGPIYFEVDPVYREGADR